MCIGIPMRVVQTEPGFAWCEGRGERRRVDTSLVGAVEPGRWVLVFLDSARELIDDARAGEIDDALNALEAALRGDALDGYFSDLVDREPMLPEHLRGPSGGKQ